MRTVFYHDIIRRRRGGFLREVSLGQVIFTNKYALYFTLNWQHHVPLILYIDLQTLAC